MEKATINATFFKATNKQLIRGEVTLESLKEVFRKLGIDSQHKLLLAKKSKALKIPGYYHINEICLSKTGLTFDDFFVFLRSVSKRRRFERLMKPEFIEEVKKWCFDNSIMSVPEYAASRVRPKEFPTHTTIVANYGYDYFTDIIGLKRYKDTLEDRLLNNEFISSLKNWCIANDITNQNRYIKADKPKAFPSAERIRQILGTDYFDQILDFKSRNYTFLSKEEARKVCVENGILTSNLYPRFYQQYNETHEIKLPSDPYRTYDTNWTEFIALSETQLFIGNSMSSLELFTYKLLHDKGIEFETEKTFDDCRSKKPLPFDFYLPSVFYKPVIIELDGEHHRITDENNLYYSKTIRKHDKIKNDYCFAKGIELIRINHIVDIEPTLNDRIGLNEIPKIKDLDWTRDFNTEEEVINSQLSKSAKVKLLLLMAERGKSNLSNVDIIKQVNIKKPPFYTIKNELIKLGLINRPNDYHFTTEEIENIVHLYKEGKNISQIIRETGYVNREYLIKRIKEAGVEYKSTKPTKEQAAELRKQIATLFDQGLKVGEIAKKLNKSSGLVSLAIKEIRIERNEVEPDEKVVKIGIELRKGLSEGKTMKQMISELGYTRQYLNKVLIWTKKYASR